MPPEKQNQPLLHRKPLLNSTTSFNNLKPVFESCRLDGKMKIKNQSIGGFHAVSADTNNNDEMNKCWWTNKTS